MSQKFDWRSEDEEEWTVDTTTGGPVKSVRPRRWLLIGMVALLVLSGGLLSFRQLGNYLDETEIEADQEILSSNELVFNAARDGDPEILASLLSGRDLNWAAGQLEILEADLLFDRKPFGVEWQEEQLPVTEVTISPGIDSAEVVNHLQYSLASGQGNAETITLKHLLHYRRSDDRWLLSPPPRDFWGAELIEEGYYLSIGFPERDSIIGRRLAVDLEGLLAALCNLDNVNSCPLAFPMQLRLVTDLTAIIQYRDPKSRLAGTLSLELPTPSLFGYPEDEAAYKALYRSYGERLVSAVVAETTGWECCPKVHIYQALLDQQLTKLGLISSPLTADHYRQALNEGITFDFADRLWTDRQPTEVRMGTEHDILSNLLIEYIVSDWYSGPIVDLQRNLLEEGSFSQYLTISIQHIGLQAFEDGWLPFLNRRLDSLEN